jgi:hypothetical protein
LPWQWFFDQLDVLKDAIQQEYKDDLTIEAFNAWQITEVVSAMLNEKHKTKSFGTYLEKLGINKTKEPEPEEEIIKKLEKVVVKQEKDQALNNANEILEQFRKGAMKKHVRSV